MSGLLQRLAPDRDDAIDAAFLFGLGGLALLGFRSAYGGFGFLWIGLVALAAGIIVAHAARRLGQPVVVTAALALVVFFLLGGVALRSSALLGFLPSGRTVLGLVDGAVHGWAQLLTTVPPAGSVGNLIAIPYLCGITCGAVGFTLARRLNRTWPVLVPPLVVLGLAILFGTEEPVSLLLQGAVFGAVSLAWLSVRSARSREIVQGDTGRSRLLGAVAMVALIVAGAVLVGPHLPMAQARERVVLRQFTEPPFDPRDYPSPLNKMRWYVTNWEKTTLFTVSGAVEGARLRLATMDDYDGAVWNVAGGVGRAVGSSGYFEKVGSTIRTETAGAPAEVALDVRDYTGVWVPVLGSATSIRFDGPRAEALAEAYRYNRATDGAVVPLAGGLAEGDRVLMDVIVPDPIAPAAIAGRAAGRVTQPSAYEVDAVKEQAPEFSGEASSAGDIATAIAGTMRTEGFFSRGEDGQGESLPGHGARRVQDFLKSGPDGALLGDEEQYAATMALLARQFSVPSRVVMGWVLPRSGTVDLTGGAISAWVEVNLDGVGWVPLDTTPPHDPIKKDSIEAEGRQQRAEVQPPPPLDVVEPAEAPNNETEEDPEDKPDPPAPPPPATSGWLMVAGIVVSVPVFLAAALLTVITGLKARRRHRRRTAPVPAHRIAEGWREVLDQARDHGDHVNPRATRQEAATLLGGPPTALLAREADHATFGAAQPQAQDAEEYWRGVDDYRRRRASGAGFWGRLRAALNVTSLRRR